MKPETKVPGATIRGTFNTCEEMKRQDLVTKCGHVVNLWLEDICHIECAAWFAGLNIACPKGVKVSIEQRADGTTRIKLTQGEQ